MATLTQTTFLSRQIIKYGSIGLVIFIILQFSFGQIVGYLKKHNPPPPPEPTVAFKKLPKIVFLENKDLPAISYTLETISGALPALDTIGKVYVMVAPSNSFLSLDKTEEIAKNIGFTDNPQLISPQVYRFSTASTPATILEINKVTNDFKLRYEYANDPNILVEKKLPTFDQAESEAKNYLSRMGLLPDEISKGKSENSSFKYSAGGLLPASSLSETDFIRVSLLREDLDQLRILPEKPKDGPISFLFSGAREPAERILEINYTYRKIDKEHFATYPLKSTATAWQELTEGKGFISSEGDNPDGKVVIRKVSLAYFDSTEPQNYLQPIFVFEGDKDFMGYVPAIDSKWTD